MPALRPTICRICGNYCPMLVEVRDGRAVKVRADPDAVTHGGYTCVKGRALPNFHYAPDRLLRPLSKCGDGTYTEMRLEPAIEEIAGKVRTIIDRYGPRSVALYGGTKLTQNQAGYPVAVAFMRAIGSPMYFTVNTIDQPGKAIAHGLHGWWQAPPQAFDEPTVALFVGINGLESHIGLPIGHPHRFLADIIGRGGDVIVIDPRRTRLATRATIHLQPRPGEDVAILAGLIRVIITEHLYDREFVCENVDGLDSLRQAVEPFTPDSVGSRADISPADLIRAARVFATASRGYAVAGTGANMGNGQGTLVEYLVLALDTLCGHYLRAGERVRNPGTLIPTVSARAQATPPMRAYGYGERMAARGLTDTLAGLPVAAIPEEILTPGDGRIRALFVVGGNPVAAWPDQALTVRALRALDLLVTLDVQMSQTARLADYVIPTPMSLEVAATTQPRDSIMFYGNGYGGFADAAAQYAPAAVRPPHGAELCEEWELFWELGRRLGVQLEIRGPGAVPSLIDMTIRPSLDDLLETLHVGSRVPLSEVKAHPHGAYFPDPPVVVAPKQEGWSGRLNIADNAMMADLQRTARASASAGVDETGVLPFRLISRRVIHAMNSVNNVGAKGRGATPNPAFLNPHDVRDLQLEDGALVRIASAADSILATVASDPGVRRGVVSMSHCFGGTPERDGEVRVIGSPTNRLITVDGVFDAYSGQPLMSNVPVRIEPVV